MKVSIEQPRVVQLMYQQEKGDPDYGSCMWARFYLDLKNYTISIESDCGNYVYGWVPTPKSESFLQLLARMDKDYLLDKISSESVVDGDATWEAIEAVMVDAAYYEGEELDFSTWEAIKAACRERNDDREIVDALKDALLPTDLFEKLDYEQTYGSIVHDYPASAKKIVEVFDTCIRPNIKILAAQESAEATVDAQPADNLSYLLSLMQAHPDLPVVPMVGTDVVADDSWGYWKGSWGTASINEYLTTENGIHFKGDDDPDGLVDLMIDPAKVEKMTVKELEAAYYALPWKKAIIVYIETPEEG